MIFCGDIAIPFRGGVTFKNLPAELAAQDWFGNLEGSLVEDNAIDAGLFLEKRIVFNSLQAIRELQEAIHFKAFGLANNHIKDAAPLNETLRHLKSLNISHVGANLKLLSASAPLIIKSGNSEYVIVAFGWDVIQCIYAKDEKEGVNPYTRENVLTQIEALSREYMGKRIITFMHWNYELELYPQPLDRELAHRLIDLGVYAVIGCHSHRVQSIEMYNGRPIVYGLGNFAFRQNTYMDGNLKFPPFSYSEMALEITDDGKYKIHEFEYNPMEHSVEYKGYENCQNNASFNIFTKEKYSKWFAAQRYQRKALPIMYFDDSNTVYTVKRRWVKLRGKFIDILVKNKILFKAIKSIISKVYGIN